MLCSDYSLLQNMIYTWYNTTFGIFTDYHEEKSLKFDAETPDFLFFVEGSSVRPASTAADSGRAFLAFKYFPTPPPPPGPDSVPVLGLLYQDPTLS